MQEELKPWIALAAVIAIIGGMFYFFGIPSREGNTPLIESLQKTISLQQQQITALNQKVFSLEEELASLKSEKHSLTISLTNADKLEGHHYEIWAFEKDKKFSAGTFKVNEKGEATNFAGYRQNRLYSDRDLSKVTSFVIGIEPDSDPDPEPTDIVLLGGNVSGNTARLKFNAINADSISGSYILATPTNGSPPNNPSSLEDSGLWFVNDLNHEASLNLPLAPIGWKYEAWVYLLEQPVSLGKFSSPKEADDFNGLSEILEQGYNAPGEDFLRNALSIGYNPNEFPIKLNRGDYFVKVSLEPVREGIDLNGKKISSIVFFSSLIPLKAPAHTTIELEKNPILPTGEIKIE